MKQEIAKLADTLGKIRTNQHCDTIEDNCHERITTMRELTLGYLDLMRTLSIDLQANNSSLVLCDDYENHMQDILSDIDALKGEFFEQMYNVEHEKPYLDWSQCNG